MRPQLVRCERTQRDTFAVAVGVRIQIYRTLAGLSVEVLALRLDCAPTWLEAVEAGEVLMEFKSAVALARALGVSIQRLMPVDEGRREREALGALLDLLQRLTPPDDPFFCAP